MEETDEFKWAVKIVIKRQMRDLIEQLRENGEEVAIISADISYGQSTHFGSPKGEWFISEQRNLANSFLDFCKKKGNKHTDTVGQSPQYSASTKTPKGMSPRVVLDKLNDFHKETASTVIRVWVPEDLSEGVSDVDLAIVFGRLWTSQIESIRKQAGNTPKKMGTPKTTRSGRVVSKTFLTAVGAMKKEPHGDASDLAEDRFQFCTLTGCTADPETAHSVNMEQLDLLMEVVIPAIEKFLQGNKLSRDGKLVKIIVAKSSFGNEVRIDVDKTQPDFDFNMPSGSGENIDLDMEVSDGNDFDDDDEGADVDYKPPMKEEGLTAPPIDFDRYVKDRQKAGQQKDGEGMVKSVVKGPQKAMSLRIGQKKELMKKRNRNKKKRNYVMMPCEHCGMELLGPHTLKAHIERVHLKIRNHKCPICAKGFWDRSCVETHTINIHTKKCDACQEYVVESIPWEEGITARTVRDVECVCGATVTMFTKFGVPKDTPAKVEDKISNKGSETGQSLFQTPTNGKMFACGECGKLFTSQTACEKHSLMHTAEKRFVCEICGIGKKSKIMLQKHLDKVHDIVTNGCKECGKNCNSQRALKIHMGRYHPKVQEDSTEECLPVDQNLPSDDNSLGTDALSLVMDAQNIEPEETDNDALL